MYPKQVMDEFRHPKNLGEIKNADAIGKVGNPTCLLPDTIVHANDHFERIDSLKESDRVLGHNGLYNQVEEKFARAYSGELIKVKNKLGCTFLTPEHEVFAVSVPKRWKFTFTKNKKALSPQWLHAYELKKGDMAVLPVLKEVEDKQFMEVKQERKRFDYRSKKIPEKITVSEEFLRLSGYYLAEGSLKEKITKTYVCFTFNSNEEELVKDVVDITAKIFGLEAKVHTIPQRKTTRVTINNIWVTRLFKSLFGKGAAEKKLPHWMILLPLAKQKSIILGLWRGDGFFNQKKPRAGYSTVSHQLALQIKTLLLRQEIVPSIYTEKEKISKDGVKHRKAYRIHVGDRKSVENLAKILDLELKTIKPVLIDSWFSKGMLFIPISGIERINYEGKVHNLKVENAMSYVTESLTVHNCGDLLWVYLKIGKNKKGKEIIKDIKVKTFGCVVAIANSSLLTKMVKGKTIEFAEKLTKQDLLKKLGKVPAIKVHCSVLAVDGLQNALKDYREKKGKGK
ncbi:MAG: iron-sulfur cluster assembly scaffold protein [Candidatus Diapherotrites archaeon]